MEYSAALAEMAAGTFSRSSGAFLGPKRYRRYEYESRDTQRDWADEVSGAESGLFNSSSAFAIGLVDFGLPFRTDSKRGS